ncbi:sensor histidine kinase [Leadbettera azotonutricia]|uniref:histidine kinase n=1 Tax=Leadbettera azotonutricia (strain ATCC BAA-888 / DSM 13862 / ZAS-9) TaxID=545695 RepID=F5Y9F8_LEAAZ|nr:ATP-binding protein [Leadbettera azotonutricia]AEF83215.1 periplasmic sensor signal transduction histidine kinase [Leadbettera azotonutricia ZAS-9]
MTNLKNRLALTYAILIVLALALLTLAVNRLTKSLFSNLVRQTISERSEEIVRTIAEQYNPMTGSFNQITIEAAGMFFVHEGYIVAVETLLGDSVWNARTCDMERCSLVIRDITERMEGRFGVKGSLQSNRYPILFDAEIVGYVDIDTYGPFFYSDAETRFLSLINHFLIIAGLAFILISVGISVQLSGVLAKPVTLEFEEGERRKKQLTQDVAHELRTPLTCLQGTVEAMIDGVYAADKERLESCKDEILRLTSLVEDLNTLSNLEWEGLKLNKTDFDLSQLLEAAAGPFIPAAREKGIEVKLNLRESPINADYDRLKQVFINLLSNAVKYTERGSIVATIQKGDKNWDVLVADTGIGIAKEDLPRIFERLYRTDKSRNRGLGGSGIGLTIATAIAKAHGGSISAESEEGKGSVFKLSL